MRSWFWTVKTKRAEWKLAYSMRRKSDSKGRMRFVAQRLKRNLSSDSRIWKLVQERFFATKWKAKDWCWKWYCRYKGIKFQSLHTVSEGRREAGKKLYKIKKLREDGVKAGLKCARKRKVVRKKVIIIKTEIDFEEFGSFLEYNPKRKIRFKK